MKLVVKGIARYPHVMKESAAKGSENYAYSVQLLIHKTSEFCKEVQSKIDEVVNNTYPSGVPAGFNTCFKDLAIEEPNNEELRDYMVLKASVPATSKPPVVDMNHKPIIDPSLDNTLVGQYIWVSGNIACYNKVQKGVKVYLNGVMVTGETGSIPLESISAKPSVEQLFEGVPTSTQSVPSPQTSSPSPITPPAPPATSLPKYQMTALANGISREEYHNQGWTDTQLIEKGLMLPPAGVTPSFS